MKHLYISLFMVSMDSRTHVNKLALNKIKFESYFFFKAGQEKLFKKFRYTETLIVVPRAEIAFMYLPCFCHHLPTQQTFSP